MHHNIQLSRHTISVTVGENLIYQQSRYIRLSPTVTLIGISILKCALIHLTAMQENNYYANLSLINEVQVHYLIDNHAHDSQYLPQ